MSLIGDLWTRLKAAVEGEKTTVESTFTALEQKLLPGFSALVQKIESTIGTQGVEILEQGLSDIATIIDSGGNIGAAVAALVPKVISQVSADLKQDAATAAHGTIDLLVASLPAKTTV